MLVPSDRRHDHLPPRCVEHKPAPLILDALLLRHWSESDCHPGSVRLTFHRDHSIHTAYFITITDATTEVADDIVRTQGACRKPILQQASGPPADLRLGLTIAAGCVTQGDERSTGGICPRIDRATRSNRAAQRVIRAGRR